MYVFLLESTKENTHFGVYSSAQFIHLAEEGGQKGALARANGANHRY